MSNLPARLPNSRVLSIGISIPCTMGISALQVAHSSCSGPRKCSGNTRKLRAREELSSPALSVVGRYDVTIQRSTGLLFRCQDSLAEGKLKLEVQLMLTLSPGR